VRCAEVRELLPAYVHEGHPSSEVRSHLDDCEACSAELTRYVALTGSLASLQDELADVPPDLTQHLMAIPGEDSRVAALRGHVARNRAAYVGGAAAALAGATVAVWRLRRRVVTA
jgi:anti-sigma factor RsiW